MKVQWSLRTLLIVMTLGGPLLAAGADAASRLAKYFAAREEACPCCHPVTRVTWAEAMREAQRVESLSNRFQVEDRRKLVESRGETAENSLQSPAIVD